MSSVDEWAGSEGTSSSEDYKHNVDTFALEVVGQNWSSEVASLSSEDWELGRMASSCRMAMDFFMSRNEGCVLGELKVVELTSVAVFIVPEGRRNASDRPF